MQVDVVKLQKVSSLGRKVVARTTQIKASVMHFASANGAMPTFSRMSGIQEWDNAVMLFVNVYGGEYKNVFLEDGYVDRLSYVRGKLVLLQLGVLCLLSHVPTPCIFDVRMCVCK